VCKMQVGKGGARSRVLKETTAESRRPRQRRSGRLALLVIIWAGGDRPESENNLRVKVAVESDQVHGTEVFADGVGIAIAPSTSGTQHHSTAQQICIRAP
jgi:hypothetical protein